MAAPVFEEEKVWGAKEMARCSFFAEDRREWRRWGRC